MKIPDTWPLAHEFACNSKACAPPPAGRGGSLPGTQGAEHKRTVRVNAVRSNYGLPPLKENVIPKRSVHVVVPVSRAQAAAKNYGEGSPQHRAAIKQFGN